MQYQKNPSNSAVTKHRLTNPYTQCLKSWSHMGQVGANYSQCIQWCTTDLASMPQKHTLQNKDYTQIRCYKLKIKNCRMQHSNLTTQNSAACSGANIHILLCTIWDAKVLLKIRVFWNTTPWIQLPWDVTQCKLLHTNLYNFSSQKKLKPSHFMTLKWFQTADFKLLTPCNEVGVH